MVAVVATAFVVVVPAWPPVSATVIMARMPPMEVLPLRFRRAVVPVEHAVSLVVLRASTTSRWLRRVYTCPRLVSTGALWCG
jgi:hypothetical protein